jgi:hypothetical protein
MNGNFAPVLMQRRPAESGLPIAGHGIPGYNNTRPKVADEQVGCCYRFRLQAARICRCTTQS